MRRGMLNGGDDAKRRSPDADSVARRGNLRPFIEIEGDSALSGSQDEVRRCTGHTGWALLHFLFIREALFSQTFHKFW